MAPIARSAHASANAPRLVTLRSVLAWAALAALPHAGLAGCGPADHFAALDSNAEGALGAMPADPCDDGETRECHVVLDEYNTVVTCLDGAQTCIQGAWSTCGGSISSRPRLGPGALSEIDKPYPSPLSLSQASACGANPCDPSCKVYEETPSGGVSPTAGGSFSYQSGSPSSIPNGFVSKGLKNPCTSVADCQFDEVCSLNVTGTCAHPRCATGAALSPTCDPCVASICAADPHCCATGWDSSCVAKVAKVCGKSCSAGTCAPWSPGQTDPTCSGVDLSAGVPCTGMIPICNRGNTTAPAGVNVWFYAANSSKFPQCNPDLTTPSVKGKCQVSKPIPPGSCVNLTEADCKSTNGNGAVLSGNQTVMVNPPVGAAKGQIAECHCENNWSDFHSGACQTVSVATYKPVVYTQTYTGTCPLGSKVLWNLFVYDTTTPSDASVVFQARVAETLAGLTGPLTTVAKAKALPLPDTQQCLTGGPSPCPILLHDAITTPTADILELVVTLSPSSDGKAAPTLESWSITYSCVPSE
jgi:hypothetical protein